MITIAFYCICSVHHEYEKPWDLSKPRLTTCNPNSKIYVTNAMPPQLVEEGQEIIFTYDVTFTVLNCLLSFINNVISVPPTNNVISVLIVVILPFRRVISSGLLAGMSILTCQMIKSIGSLSSILVLQCFSLLDFLPQF